MKFTKTDQSHQSVQALSWAEPRLMLTSWKRELRLQRQIRDCCINVLGKGHERPPGPPVPERPSTAALAKVEGSFLSKPDWSQSTSASVNTCNQSRAKSNQLLLSAEEVASMIGISRSKFYELHSGGAVPAPVNLGNRVLWRPREIQAWVDAGCPSRSAWEEMRETT